MLSSGLVFRPGVRSSSGSNLLAAAIARGLGSPEPGHTSFCQVFGCGMSYLQPRPHKSPSSLPQLRPMVIALTAPILGAGRLPRASRATERESMVHPSSSHCCSSQDVRAFRSMSLPRMGSLVAETRLPSLRRRTAAPCFPGSIPRYSTARTGFHRRPQQRRC